jgi:hypothetical membrane protein
MKNKTRQPGLLTLIVASIAGPVLFWSILIILSFLNPEYNAIQDSMSRLVFGPYGWLQTFNFILLGLTIGCLGLALRLGLGPGREMNIITAIFAVMAAGQIVSGVFKADFPPSDIISSHALVHQIGASAAALGFPLCAFLCVPIFRRLPAWQGLAAFSLSMGVVIILLDAVREILLPTHWLDPWFGLFERVLLLAIIIWSETVAVRLWSVYRPRYLKTKR